MPRPRVNTRRPSIRGWREGAFPPPRGRSSATQKYGGADPSHERRGKHRRGRPHQRTSRMKAAAMDRDTTARALRATAGIAVVVLLSTALAARSMAAEWRGHWEGGWHGHEVPHW